MPLTSLEIVSFPEDTHFRARAVFMTGYFEAMDLCRKHALSAVWLQLDQPTFVVTNARARQPLCEACATDGGVLGLVHKYKREADLRSMMQQYAAFKRDWK